MDLKSNAQRMPLLSSKGCRPPAKLTAAVWLSTSYHPATSKGLTESTGRSVAGHIRKAWPLSITTVTIAKAICGLEKVWLLLPLKFSVQNPSPIHALPVSLRSEQLAAEARIGLFCELSAAPQHRHRNRRKP